MKTENKRKQSVWGWGGSFCKQHRCGQKAGLVPEPQVLVSEVPGSFLELLQFICFVFILRQGFLQPKPALTGYVAKGDLLCRAYAMVGTNSGLLEW